jgi:hypothetical protein
VWLQTTVKASKPEKGYRSGWRMQNRKLAKQKHAFKNAPGPFILHPSIRHHPVF